MPMKYSKIYEYWNNNPCDGGQPGFPFAFFKGAKVLEIGCGTGIDALRFVLRGASYTGIDLTPKAVLTTRLRIGPYGQAKVMNAEFLDFPDNYFDLVYSWGVIHHAVTPKNIINEAYRVLKPKGFISIMLYGAPSFRYFEIMVLRRILWHLHYYKYNELRRQTPRPTKEQWLSWNTDNIGCPLSRVYTKADAAALLDKFDIKENQARNKGWFRILVGRKP